MTYNDALERKVEEFLAILNPNWQKDPDMKETPIRVSKMFRHFFRGHNGDEVKAIMSKVFPTINDQMVIVKDIECFGMCPHHLVPIIYKVHIGYIPAGWALGLSKFARLAIALAAYPKLQENFTTEIADVLQKHLNPLGVMVVVNGVHGCMRCRGVEMDSATITSDTRGAFRDSPATRAEFMNLLEV